MLLSISHQNFLVKKDKLLNSNFTKLKEILAQNGYSSKKEISSKLIEIYTKEIRRHDRQIQELEHKRLLNIEADSLNRLLGMIPEDNSADKILKYERSIEKSIFQNILLLKRLQGNY